MGASGFCLRPRTMHPLLPLLPHMRRCHPRRGRRTCSSGCSSGEGGGGAAGCPPGASRCLQVPSEGWLLTLHAGSFCGRQLHLSPSAAVGPLSPPSLSWQRSTHQSPRDHPHPSEEAASGAAAAA